LKTAFDGGFASKDNLGESQGKGNQGCLFRQKARPQGDRYVPKHLCIQKIAMLPRRHRVGHFLAQALLWPGSVYLERLAWVQKICLVGSCIGQLAYNRTKAIGLSGIAVAILLLAVDRCL
jgi:hypothetical protein